MPFKCSCGFESENLQPYMVHFRGKSEGHERLGWIDPITGKARSKKKQYPHKAPKNALKGEIETLDESKLKPQPLQKPAEAIPKVEEKPMPQIEVAEKPTEIPQDIPPQPIPQQIAFQLVPADDKRGDHPLPEEIVGKGIPVKVTLSISTLAYYQIASTQYRSLTLGTFLDSCADDTFRGRGLSLGLVKEGGKHG